MRITYSLKTTVIYVAMIFSGAFLLANFLNSPLVVASPEGNLCGGADLSLESGSCTSKGKNPEGKLNSLVGSIINILTIIVGIIAVIMIIIGGFRFVTSGGDSGRLTSARQTVIYAVVGLIIVALAQVIVRFVLKTV